MIGPRSDGEAAAVGDGNARQVDGDFAGIQTAAGPAYGAIGTGIVGDAGYAIVGSIADEDGNVGGVGAVAVERERDPAGRDARGPR